MAQEAVVKFRADTTEFISETQKVINQLQIVQEFLTGRGQGPAFAANFGDLKTFSRDAKAADAQLAALVRRLETLQQIQARGPTTLGPKGGLAPLRLSAEEQAATGLGGKASRKQVEEAINQALAQGNAILNQRAEVLSRIEQLARRHEQLARSIYQISAQQQFLEEQRARVLSGATERDIVTSRIQELQRVLAELERARVEVERQVTQALGRQRGGRLARDTSQSERQLSDVNEALARNAKQIANIELAASDRKVQGTRRALELENRLTQALERQSALIREQQRLRTAVTIAQAEGAFGADATGAAGTLKEIDDAIGQTQEALFQTIRGGIDVAAPELRSLQQELAKNLSIKQRTAEVDRQELEIRREISRLEREAPTRGLEDASRFTAEALREQQIANLPTLERTLFTAFDDVGRRFRTALQFAISGAIIFGAQQLVREFAQAAIQVERTFADIESALEFDIGFERGSVRFNQEVERIRREVLLLANEFNVLPTEANEAAFKMVARFQDSENALKAVRAQFLATKISTIDQSEALRALTATAEGFASAILEANNAMTFQERLLERERLAAEGYAQALDEAVLIQQRFGIEVEDTLEGTARAAETFRQLGFTRQQTEATVAAVSFQLGQTGVNVAERLNRAFGGITQPEVRDALLDLAAASDAFTLTLDDFESGAAAVEALDRQIRQLEQIEPQTALQIRDILGQRRETEVVAAFFGTADLRRSIESSLSGAAGAAERRFGFLAETVSERIQSIIAEFQSLAQNFERLELLGPLKAVLAVIEGTLGGINRLLQFLDNVVQGLDRLGEVFGVRLGTTLKNLTVLALTLLSILRTAQAGAVVVGLARAGSIALGNRAREAATQGGGALFGTIVPLLLGLKTSAKEAGSGLAGLKVGAAKFGTALGYASAALLVFVGRIVQAGLMQLGAATGSVRLASAFGLSQLALGGWTAALIAATLVITELVASGKTGLAARDLLATSPERAQLAVQQRARTGEFEGRPAFEKLARAEEELEDLRLKSAEEVRTGWGTLLASMAPLFDKATRENIGIRDALISQLVPGISTDEKLIPGSQQWWDELIKESVAAWRTAQRTAVTESLGDLRGQVLTGEQQEIAANFGRRNAELAAQFAAADTPEKLAEAEAAQDLLLDAFVSFLDSVGDGAGAIETSMKKLQAEVSQLDRDLATGRTPAFNEAGRRFQLAQKFRDMAAQIARGGVAPSEIDAYNAALEAADQQQLAGIDAQQAGLERQRARLELIADPATRLAAQAKVLNQEIQLLVRNGQTGTAEYLDLVDQLASINNEAANVAQENAIAAAQRNVDLAQSLEEYLAAQAALIAVMNEGLKVRVPPIGTDSADRKFFPSDPIPPEVRAKIEADQQKILEDMEDKANEEARRLAEARTRLAGPIRSRITQINAQIAALRTQIAQGFFSEGEALLAQVQLAELIADRAEAEAEAIAAWIRTKVGVDDSIRSLQAELVITARQMKLTAKLYGKNSGEFANLKIAQDQLRQQLVVAQLELEDLSRRLGTDITNDFAQAQLDLVEVIRRLTQLPGMGDLEKARLQLERRQAEARAQRAFFDDRLFNLRFAFETGDIGLSAYISSLRRLLSGVDTSTQQGKEIFLEISNLIDSLTEDVSDMAFNIPSEIRLPTIFEIRRAMAADQLGVNYMDNRTQTIQLNVANSVELDTVLQSLDTHFGDTSDLQFRRSAVGAASITPGGF